MRIVQFAVVAALACLPVTAESRDVFTFVQKNCGACHNSSTKAGDLDLTSLKTANTFENDRETWELVVEKLKLGQMPPAGVAHPQSEATAAITGWLENEFVRQDALLKPQAGRVAARRLNRAEYNNTIRDLLGVDIRPADNFPASSIAAHRDESCTSGARFRNVILDSRRRSRSEIRRSTPRRCCEMPCCGGASRYEARPSPSTVSRMKLHPRHHN